MAKSGVPPLSKELRIIYLAGPGDAPSVLRSQAAGEPYADIPHVAYSAQLFDVSRELGAHVLSVSTHRRLDDFSHGNIRAVNRFDHTRGTSGIGFHKGIWAQAREVRRDVAEFRANVVLTLPAPYPFLIQSLAKTGVQLVPALHAILWPEFTKPTVARRLAVQLSRGFYSKVCPAILSHPGGAVRQVHELTGGRTRPIVEFLPLFRPDLFAGVAAPVPDAEVFRVMTVGRVEADKGIFALIEIARRLREQGGSPVRFDVCGTGSAIDEARRRVSELGLGDTVTLHGWTEMNLMKQLWGESHVALVPTTSQFVEGFNQVVIEATIAGRPVITSRVCPALDYVRGCSIEVEVDDIDGYVRAIAGLAADRNRYRALQARTDQVKAPFLDEKKSFAAALRHVLTSLAQGRPITPIEHPPERIVS